MPPEKMSSSEVVSILNLWSKKIMAEEQSGDPPVELREGYEDKRFMSQVTLRMKNVCSAVQVANGSRNIGCLTF